METADPFEPPTSAWCIFLLHTNLHLPALIGLVCYPWPQMVPLLYASSWPIHPSLLTLLAPRPVLSLSLCLSCSPSLLLHPWAGSGLCHSRPQTRPYPSRRVGCSCPSHPPALPRPLPQAWMVLEEAGGGPAPHPCSRGSTGLSQTLEVRPPRGAQHPTGVSSTLFIIPLPP